MIDASELFAQKRRLRGAAHRAKTRYPGPVGELVARELTSFAEFDMRLGRDSVLLAVAEELLVGGDRVLATPVKEDSGGSG